MILPETDSAPAYLVAERLRANIEKLAFDINENESINATVSIGVANLLQSDDSLSNVISRADEALYKAKKEGRNLVR